MNLQNIRKQISKSVDRFLDFAEDKKKELNSSNTNSNNLLNR
jgi:hypothetical protein